MPVKCDHEGSLYFRSLDGQRARIAVRTLRKVGRDGTLKAKYSLESAPELTGLDVQDFGVSSDGRVYATAASPSEIFVIEFDEGGTFKSKTKLARLFKPTQLAVFKSGEFLISGVELPESSETVEPDAFTGIFGRDGRLIRAISVSEAKRKEADQPKDQETDLTGINPEVEFGFALMGDDGNAYLLRSAYPAVIYVISSGGEILRTLKIDLGRSYVSASPRTMFVAQGKLLLLFSDDKESFFELADVETGEVQAEYFGTPELGEALGCYTGTELIFLGVKNGKLQLTHAEPGPPAPPR